MKINIKDIEYIANLARLELSEDEKKQQLEKMNTILDYMEIIKEVNTDGVEPMVHVIPINNVFRKDEVQETLDREQTVQNAPEEAQGMFRVPKIV